MKSTLELRQQANEQAEKAAAILNAAAAAGRSTTAEEALQARKHTESSMRMLNEAERQDLAEVQGRLSAPQPRRTTPMISSGGDIEVHSGVPLYRGALRSFRGPTAEEDAFRSGQWLLATLGRSDRAQQYCRKHGIETRAMAEGVNVAGGFLVPDELERSIINLRDEYGEARRECRTVQMGSDTMSVPRRSGGLTSHFTGENDPITESDMAWTSVRLTARKLATLTRISTELNEDSVISIADILAQEIGLAFATKEDVCAIDGDGTSPYGGMIGIRTKMIDGDHAGSYVDNTSTGDNWNEITDLMLLAVMAVLPKYARRGAKWHCSPVAKSLVFDRLLRATGGNSIVTIQTGTNGSYMGYPIVEWSAMPSDDGSAVLNNKIMMFFGNLAQAATIGSRRGITIKPLLERYADTDQIGIQATERFDFNCHDIGGETAAERGPIVGMLGGT